MAQAFGFNQDELKLLLVAVRHIRRTFAAALERSPDPSLQTYAALYDGLSDKLIDMAGPMPENLESMFE
ncbi:MAG TPA: hypothetical protein VLY24_09815 [Bryobacteraceae bacterium]|nr:hypothetical protein [Bryobacteraceae bacterium]